MVKESKFIKDYHQKNTLYFEEIGKLIGTENKKSFY
jgi:hypothetical protein